MKVFFLLSCVTLLELACAHHSDDWHHTTVLDGRFQVSWTTYASKDKTEWIKFKVEVRAHGYVGLGISPNGGMGGSDIVTAWIRDGKVYFQDRHGTGNTFPPLDDSQDWRMTGGQENDTHTIFQFRRQLDTCDEDDMKIDNSTVHLIYAYSENDPPGDDPVYHDYDKRGSKSVLLLQPEVHLNTDKSELKHWDVLSPNFEITDEYDSVYWCKIFKSPELDAKHHIVLVEPVIDQGSEEFVHHMLLYECVGGTSDELEPLVSEPGHKCFHPNMPDSMKKCDGVFLAWGVGGGDTVLPPHVGIPLEPSPSTYFMLEIHYDNPQLKSGIKDNSGLRLYYTPKLRDFDAGALMLGTTVNQRLIVPPGQKEYTIAAHSSPDCLSPVMPKEGIKVLGVFLHAHLLGRHLKARHFRNSVELAPLADDANYDFNYQDYHYYSKEITVLPEDQIAVECTYDSTGRNYTTFGGLSTQEEMCLAFLLHYPKLKRYASLSAPSINSLNEILINPLNHQELSNDDIQAGVLKMTLSNESWSEIDVAEIGQKLRKSKHSIYCYLGNGKKNSIKGYISYPKDLKPYKAPITCPVENPHINEKERVTAESATEKLILSHFLKLICMLMYFSIFM